MHKIMRLPQVIKDTGLARSTIYKKVKENSFPKPISLGAKSVGWLEADVQNWIEVRIISSQIADR
jgi:prophage regulatory protein|nr:AlpA family transcriptional regulator [uncultured Flavobacterium sp.]